MNGKMHGPVDAASVPQDRSERAVEKILDESVRRGERWMVRCRVFFSLISFTSITFGSWFWRDGVPSPRGWFVMSMGASFLVFSLWMARRTSRGPISRWLLSLSVTVDACMCCTALLGNAIWHRPGYLGNFNSLEISALPLTIVISGFRLSPRVVWVSVGINSAFAVMLRLIDISILEISVGWILWAKLGIYLSSAAILAMVIAIHTRRLVMAGAIDALRAHRAHQALGTLLQDHHDVRSLISSANLNVELLHRAREEGRPQSTSLGYLREDLQAVSSMVSILRERTLQELSSLEGNLWADVAETASAVIPLIVGRFPDVLIEVDVPVGLRLRISGGAVVMKRVLLNLLTNAGQGDGTRGARRIWLRARRREAQVLLWVEDDGPGFSEALLRSMGPAMATSKRDGSGLGLFLVQVAISASEGSLTLGQRSGGGASVELVLPAR